MVTVDALVLGGGPAGSAAAATVARSGGRAILIDPLRGGHSTPRVRAGEGAAPGTARLVEEIFGAEARAFRADRHLVCPGILAAWGRGQASLTEHLWNPVGPAWNIDREVFDEDLRGAARRIGVAIRPGKARSVEREGGLWAVAVEGGDGRTEQLRGRVLLDAAGRAGYVGRRHGVPRHDLDRLVALWSIWTVGPDDRAATLVVEADRHGWWYSAPVPGGRRVVAFLTDADLLPADRATRRRLVLAARHMPLIGPLLETGSASLAAPPSLLAARSSWLERAAGPGWLAAGDAAYAPDPLSGRGIVSALLMGRAAGRAALAHGDRSDDGFATGLYEELVRRLVADGVSRWAETYGAEQRWPEATFWRRRHEWSGRFASVDRSEGRCSAPATVGEWPKSTVRSR